MNSNFEFEKGSHAFELLTDCLFPWRHVHRARKLRLECAEGADRAAAAPRDDHEAQVAGRTTGDGHLGKRGRRL